MKGALKRVLQVIILILAFYYVFRELIVNIGALKENPPNFNLEVLLGLLIIWLPYIFAPMVWGVIVRRIGGNVNLKEAFSAWSLSNIGKYAPGKIWHIVGRFSLLNERTSLLGESILIEVSANLSAAFFAGLTAYFYGLNIEGLNIILVAGALVSFLFILFPSLLQRSLRFAVRLFKRSYPVPRVVERRFYVLLVLTYYIFWWFYGLGFYIFIRGFGEGGSVPLYTGIYAVAWTLGYLSFITPGGLGIREGVLIYLLKPHLNPGMPAIVAILARLSIILCEVFLFLSALYIRKTQR